jgi:hypothetical protein
MHGPAGFMRMYQSTANLIASASSHTPKLASMKPIPVACGVAGAQQAARAREIGLRMPPCHKLLVPDQRHSCGGRAHQVCAGAVQRVGGGGGRGGAAARQRAQQHVDEVRAREAAQVALHGQEEASRCELGGCEHACL